MEIDKLETHLRDYHLDMDDNVYMFFTWIVENRDIVMPKIHNKDTLNIYLYYFYLKEMHYDDTKEIRNEFKELIESTTQFDLY